jgi:hypothetical protein
MQNCSVADLDVYPESRIWIRNKKFRNFNPKTATKLSEI